jgi:hypothetical protein
MRPSHPGSKPETRKDYQNMTGQTFRAFLLSFLCMMTFGAFFGVIHPILIPVPGIACFLYLMTRPNADEGQSQWPRHGG